MEQLNGNEISFIKAYTKYGIGLNVGGGVTITQSNIVSIDTDNPTTQIISDYVETQLSTQFDFILFEKTLKKFKSALHVLKKCYNDLKVGGRLIICEDTGKWYFQEMEGLLYLMKDFFIVDQKFDARGSYVYVLRKLGGE